MAKGRRYPLTYGKGAMRDNDERTRTHEEVKSHEHHQDINHEHMDKDTQNNNGGINTTTTTT
jgi:hypothetical protein